MDEAEFDRFADEYRSMHEQNIKVSGESPEYFAEYKIQDIARELGGHGHRSHDGLRVLDFGGGIGNSVPYVRRWLPGARLTCADVSKKSLEIAGGRFPGQAEYVPISGDRLPFDDQSFEVVFVSCVFHHIPHEEHVRILTELNRVLRGGGHLFLFEHNPFNPLTVQAVNTCPFDENARLIRPGVMRQRVRSAGFGEARVRFRIFFPHGLRGLRPLESRLSWLPLGAQYYVMARKS